MTNDSTLPFWHVNIAANVLGELDDLGDLTFFDFVLRTSHFLWKLPLPLRTRIWQFQSWKEASAVRALPETNLGSPHQADE